MGAKKEQQVSDIQRFAKAYFGIELTKYQLEVIDAIAKDKHIRIGKRLGFTTVKKVLRAYLDEGLKPEGRRRLPNVTLPRHNTIDLKGLTQEGKILALIKRPQGAFNFELSRYALKYTSVVSALRKDGHNIVAERQYLKNGKASNTFLYYLIED